MTILNTESIRITEEEEEEEESCLKKHENTFSSEKFSITGLFSINARAV